MIRDIAENRTQCEVQPDRQKRLLNVRLSESTQLVERNCLVDEPPNYKLDRNHWHFRLQLNAVQHSAG